MLTESISYLKKFIKASELSDIKDLSKKTRGNILNSANDIPEYKTSKKDKYLTKNQRAPMVVTSKCINCRRCIGINCYAISVSSENIVSIKEELCSGCGWCEIICPTKNAIKRKYL